MFKGALIFIVFLSLVSLTCINIDAQGRSTISGFVFDSHRTPIPELPVELLNELNSMIGRTRTDGAGRYFFSGLSSGRFYIRVITSSKNLEEQTQEVEISGVGVTGQPLSDNVQKDFYLKARKTNNLPQVNEVIFAQDVPQEAQTLYKKAVSNLDDKKIDTGVEQLEKALAIFPNFYLALERLGLVKISQEKYEEAKKYFSVAVQINDRGFNSLYGLGYANYALKQAKDAIQYSEKAVSLNSNSMEALLLLGVSLRLDKQYEKAEQPLKQASKLSKGTSPDVHWNLALLYGRNLGRYNEAADELELYLKASPNVPNKEDIKKLIKEFRQKSSSTN